jgi:hypothetical protein
MVPFTTADRQKGRAGMEAKLTDMQRFWRSFASGRPSIKLRKLDPVHGLTFVCEMRDRLEASLPPELKLTSVGIGMTAPNAPVDSPGALLVVPRGKEHKPLKTMLTVPGAWVICAMFWVLDEANQEKRVFCYDMDRSDEAIAISDWLWKRQLGAKLRN